MFYWKKNSFIIKLSLGAWTINKDFYNMRYKHKCLNTKYSFSFLSKVILRKCILTTHSTLSLIPSWL